MQDYFNIRDEIDERKKNGLYRTRKTIDSPQGATIKIDGQDYINFSSNDYLGLANNDSLKEFMVEAIREHGLGSASSQLITGYSKTHEDLENKLSKFFNRDSALIFPSGYQANLAIASTLINSDTFVFQDKLNHASLIDAALLSKGKLKRYIHNDIDSLARLLEKYKKQNCIVMTDSVFSMDGDYARLVEIVDLCKTYRALLVVDDAHGIGVLGKSGAGLLEKLSLDQEQVPLLIGTFGKAFGMGGAFVSGEETLIDAFLQKARSYIYTTAILPPVAATINYAVDLISNSIVLREKIEQSITHFKNKLSLAGFKDSGSISHIQPVLIGEADETLRVSEELFNNNIIATAIRPPTVPIDTSRLRISLTANHTLDQIDQLVDLINKIIHK